MKRLLYSFLFLVSAVTTSYGQGTKIVLRANNGTIDNRAQFTFANSFFDDGVVGVNSTTTTVQRIGDVIYGLVNDFTGEASTYSKITTWPGTGGPMSDDRIDGHIYRKKGSEYFRLNYELYSVKLWGAVGDGVHDDHQAIMDAITHLPHNMDAGTTQPSPGSLIYFPRGKYFSSDSIPVTRACHFFGEGSFVGSSSLIIFPANKDGFIVYRFDTRTNDGNGNVIHYDSSRAADGTIFENLGITQRPGGSRGIGIFAHSTPELINCSITNWRGIGIYIAGNASNPNGTLVKKIWVSNQGLNYTSAPTVTVTPLTTGSGCVAHAVLGGQVMGTSLTSGGSGYIEPPSVIIVESDGLTEATFALHGFGARGGARMGLNTASVTNGGSGYTTATVAVTGSTGPFVADPAICEVVVDTAGEGGIAAINVLSGGSGYNAGTGTAVVITDTSGGSGAVAHAIVDGGGHVTSVVVDDPGSNYTDATVTVDITGGSLVRPNASATATISGGVITAINITSPGVGYATLSACHIAITGDGSGATASPNDLKVVGIAITRRGINYEATDTPFVFFHGGRRGTGSDAAGRVSVIGNYKVKRVVIDAAGTGYYTPPLITLSGGGGTGATAWSTRVADEFGNANRWKMRDCRFVGNGYAVFISGGDANAGSAIGCDATANTFTGFTDDSFLGNTYVGCHTNGNQFPYKSTQNTASNVYIGCYAEGNQMPVVGLYPAKWYNGTTGAGFAGSIETDGNRLSMTKSNVSGRINATFFGNPDEILTLDADNLNTAQTMRWHYDLNLSDMWMDWSNTTNNRNWLWTGPYTNRTFGRSSPVPYAEYVPAFFTGGGGSSTDARQITSSASFPPTTTSTQGGKWARGDFVFSTNPTSASGRTVIGWLRLTTGTADVNGTDWLEVTTRDDANITNIAHAAIFDFLVTTQTANYTLVLADAGSFIRQNSASGTSVTVPPNSSVAFAVGAQIVIGQIGAGQVTLIPGSGVTLNSAGGMLKTRAQYSTLTLIKTVSPDTWLVSGDIAN